LGYDHEASGATADDEDFWEDHHYFSWKIATLLNPPSREEVNLVEKTQSLHLLGDSASLLEEG
jgi:hypothetical protein